MYSSYTGLSLEQSMKPKYPAKSRCESSLNINIFVFREKLLSLNVKYLEDIFHIVVSCHRKTAAF